MLHLTAEELIHIANRATGTTVGVRDAGLLESAAARPQTSLFGQDAYPDLVTKAAALTQSIVGNHALVDGNKRLGLGALIAFLGINGHTLTWSNDEAYDFIIAIADGSMTEVDEIAARLRPAVEGNTSADPR
ncbi:type II toxin-antitoxin system death-on-curing family toxin [Naumannella sp. ID2617S]|nr:type II toxin-antitoxin system death-on-curing family toxin [Naumannella sp. ID2617S]